MSSKLNDLSGSTLVECAPCGHLVMDENKIILAVNNRLSGWLGMTSAELIGVHVNHVFSMASKIVFETSIVPILSLRGQVDSATLDLKAKDGAKVPVLLSAEISGTSPSRVTNFVFLLADARRSFERELANARIQAEDELSTSQREGELREQFVAILGHDLRNPLASISSAFRILSKEPLSDRGEKIIALTQGSVQRMSRLIDNLLDFARNRLGGGIELDLSSGNAVVSEIWQVIEELRSAQPDRDIHADISDNLNVICDVSRVGQLLSNLLSNALTYGDHSCPIHVIAEQTGSGDFELIVKNQGEPIPPSAMEHLFDPFVRNATDENQRGLGLGLYIASEIAKAHGGRLEVSSDADDTAFTFSLRASERGSEPVVEL